MELKEIAFSDMTNRMNKNEIGFNHQTRIFQLLLGRYLSGIRTKDVKYLNVYCIDKVKEILIDPFVIEGGLTVKIPYNPIRFLACKTDEEKFNEYTRIINEYIAPVFKEKEWDFSPVYHALNKIEEHKYQAEFILKGTPKKSPDRRHIAHVIGIHMTTTFKLIAKIYDKDGLLIKEKILVEDIPNEIVYRRYLGMSEWIDNKTFQVISKTRLPNFFVTFDRK